MKKLFMLIVGLMVLSSCTTYKPYFPPPGERVNPYDQHPVPDDGAAGMVRDIIRRSN